MRRTNDLEKLFENFYLLLDAKQFDSDEFRINCKVEIELYKYDENGCGDLVHVFDLHTLNDKADLALAIQNNSIEVETYEIDDAFEFVRELKREFPPRNDLVILVSRDSDKMFFILKNSKTGEILDRRESFVDSFRDDLPDVEELEEFDVEVIIDLFTEAVQNLWTVFNTHPACYITDYITEEAYIDACNDFEDILINS